MSPGRVTRDQDAVVLDERRVAAPGRPGRPPVGQLPPLDVVVNSIEMKFGWLTPSSGVTVRVMM